MIRTVFALIVVVICGDGAFSQVTTNRFEKLIHQTGVNLKVDSYPIPDFRLDANTVARAKILEVFVGRENHSFYRIEWGNYQSVIYFPELLELQNGLVLAKEQSNEVLKSAPDHTDGKFTTSDGFEIGFMRSKGKVTWFISNQSAGSMVLLPSIDVIAQQILLAIDRLKQLR